MFVKAKKILASELMYAKSMDEEEAAAWLDDVLSRAGQPKPKSRAKPKAATASAQAAPALPEPLGADRRRWIRRAARHRSSEGVRRPRRTPAARREPRPARSLPGSIDAIVVAAPPGLGGAVDPPRRGARPRRRSCACVTGGATRRVGRGRPRAEVTGGALVVIVHDAARPLVDDGQ